MLAYVLKRIAHSTLVLLLASMVVFLLLHLAPGDPAAVLAGSDASPTAIEAMREQMDLNRPLPVQYATWLGHVLQGDMGRSFRNGIPVADLILQRMPATLELALAGTLIAILTAIPTGVLAAVHARRPLDWAISSFNAVIIAVPGFWTAILGILLFAVVLEWLPPGGRIPFTEDPFAALKHILLPALALGLAQSAVLSRHLRASLLHVMGDDYITTAHGKGVRPAKVVTRHALPNALVPVVTVLGLQLGRLLGGVVLIEAVFAWPGLGRLVLHAINERDYALVQGSLLVLTTAFVLVNLLTDLSYGYLDPRIRVAGKRAR